MKKLLLATVLLAAVASGYSQGTVNFQNVNFQTPATTAANGHQNRLVYALDNSTALTGTNWFAQLYYASGLNQAETSLNAVDLSPKKFRDPASASGFEGTWSGGTKTMTGVAAAPNDGSGNPGGSATLQVRVWDGALFPTGYAAAVAGGGAVGKSVTFNYTVPAFGSPATSFFMEGLQSFTLQVPEPSTIALGILGAASLLIVRRRK